MQIVIEIPDRVHYGIEKGITVNGSSASQIVLDAIKTGTPLPEHYGRLIDADAYINKHAECGWLDDITVDEFNEITPTIIPATKGEERCK